MNATNILPVSGWNKGSAVRRLRARLKPRAILYVGDDLTDRDAFRVLGRRDLSVYVGRDGHLGARYHLKSTGEIPELLNRLVHL